MPRVTVAFETKNGSTAEVAGWIAARLRRSVTAALDPISSSRAERSTPATASDFSTWTLTDQWYPNNVENQTWVPYPGDAGLTGFVIDSSCNGQGPWVGNEDWCNPPDRGLGLRPTSNTGVPLIYAYLWVKIPAESDGSCTRGTAGPGDPVRGMVDPAAGKWFPQLALELAHNATPPLKTGWPWGGGH